jgi:hypothetical protein
MMNMPYSALQNIANVTLPTTSNSRCMSVIGGEAEVRLDRRQVGF